MTKTIYECERRKFDTLEAAQALAAEYFRRRNVVVAITSRIVRIRRKAA